VSRILVLGSAGQLAHEIVRTTPKGVELKALSRIECDVTNETAVTTQVRDFRPEVIINTAAYTAVDRAESDRERAFAVNAKGAKNVADAAHAIGALLVYISTDYVFGGCRATPYPPSEKPDPLGVYGASKAEGERAVLTSGAQALVIRTSWLYAAHGKNFLTTMLKLLHANPTVKVVDDQIGAPTACFDLAAAVWKCLDIPGARGILHWTNSGVASWYDFAVAIQQLALVRALLPAERRIVPIRSSEYPVAARRPSYSVLDSRETWKLIGREGDHWQIALARTLDQIGTAA